MHRVGDRRYVGGPGETATVTTELAGGGQVGLDLDGQAFPGGAFDLPGDVGAQKRLRITLVGPVGASCVVGIAVVNGGQDGDLLLCQPFDPAPVQFYDFSVAPAAAIGSLATMKRLGEKAREPRAAKARKPKKAGKTRATRKAAKKPRAAGRRGRR